MLAEQFARFDGEFFRLLFDFFLLGFVLFRFGFVLGRWLFAEAGENIHFAAQDARFNAFGLVEGPLIGAFDLRDHRFVGGMAGFERGYRSEGGGEGRAQGDAHDPAAASGVLVHFFLKMLCGDLRGFHFRRAGAGECCCGRPR